MYGQFIKRLYHAQHPHSTPQSEYTNVSTDIYFVGNPTLYYSTLIGLRICGLGRLNTKAMSATNHINFLLRYSFSRFKRVLHAQSRISDTALQWHQSLVTELTVAGAGNASQG